MTERPTDGESSNAFSADPALSPEEERPSHENEAEKLVEDAAEKAGHRVRFPSLWLAGRALLVFLCFGTAGFLAAWREVSHRTLPFIFTASGLDLLEQTSGTPVPKLLNWNESHLEWMLLARDLQGSGLLLGGIGIGFLLLLGCLYALNPTFRLFRTLSVFDTERVGRSLRVSFLFLTPALLLIALTFILDHGRSVGLWVLRCCVLSLSLWTGLAESGQLGDLSEKPRPSRQAALKPLLLLSLVSTLTILVLLIGFPPSLASGLEGIQMLGTFNRWGWMQTGGHYLLAATMVCGTIGVSLFALAFPLKTPVRAALLLLCSAAAFYCFSLSSAYSPKTLLIEHDVPLSSEERNDLLENDFRSNRFLLTVPEGDRAAESFRRKAGLAKGELPSAPGNDLVLFTSVGVLTAHQPGYTLDGISVSPDGKKTVKAFLAARNYQSAFSWLAIRCLYNVNLFEFDVSGGIEALILDLERCPHLAKTSAVLRQMLFTCSASPRNLELLDRYANRNKFACPDREACRLMGELYDRMGQREKALTWYGFAEMPKSFLAKVQSEKPMFHQGTVTGRLTLNGKPLARVKVGAVPNRMNGLPKNLAEEILVSMRIIRSGYFSSARFPVFQVMPFALRYAAASAQTDANGEFRIESLTEGSYRLIASLPPGVKLRLGRDPGLSVKNAPTTFVVNYKTPVSSLGEISLTRPAKP